MNFEILITACVSIIGGGGLAKLWEQYRQNGKDIREDVRTGHNQLIDQLQEQIKEDRRIAREDRLSGQEEIDSIKKEMIEMKIMMRTQNERITDLEKENAILKTKNEYQEKKEKELLKKIEILENNETGKDERK